MITAIHQPQYLPWLGYFNKIASSDVFILLDDVQFKKNEWQNRNRIRTPQGWQWMTVPVLHDFGQTISEVKINNKVKWRQAHLKAMDLNYKRAPFWDEYRPAFEEFYRRQWQTLGEVNVAAIRMLVKMLGITTPLVMASDYSVTTVNTQRLIDLCQKMGADTYLSGVGGEDYMDMALFKENNISLLVQDFEHPVYPQLWKKTDSQEFISHLSVVDLILNVEKNSLRGFYGQKTEENISGG